MITETCFSEVPQHWTHHQWINASGRDFMTLIDVGVVRINFHCYHSKQYCVLDFFPITACVWMIYVVPFTLSTIPTNPFTSCRFWSTLLAQLKYFNVQKVCARLQFWWSLHLLPKYSAVSHWIYTWKSLTGAETACEGGKDVLCLIILVLRVFPHVFFSFSLGCMDQF